MPSIHVGAGGNVAKLTGLFQRGSIYYVRVVLPIKHPLRAIYKSGKVVTSIGELIMAVPNPAIMGATTLGNWFGSFGLF